MPLPQLALCRYRSHRYESSTGSADRLDPLHGSETCLDGALQMTRGRKLVHRALSETLNPP